MAKYNGYDIDIKKADYSNSIASFFLPNGDLISRSEEDASPEELELIGLIKEDVQNRENTIDIEIIRQQKIDELDIACTADIESGFYSTAGGRLQEPILWGLDLKTDQPNLNQQASDIGLGETVEPIYWNPKGGTEAVDITILQFKALWNDAKISKWSKIMRYRTLKAQVIAATTVEEILSIAW